MRPRPWRDRRRQRRARCRLVAAEPRPDRAPPPIRRMSARSRLRRRQRRRRDRPAIPVVYRRCRILPRAQRDRGRLRLRNRPAPRVSSLAENRSYLTFAPHGSDLLLGEGRRTLMKPTRFVLPVLFLVGCGAPDDTAAVQASALACDERDNPNPALFDKNARPFGLSMESWSERWWAWMMGTPLAVNPNLDPNADCNANQEGPM